MSREHEDLLDRAAKELERLSRGSDASDPPGRPCCHKWHHNPHSKDCETNALIAAIRELVG